MIINIEGATQLGLPNGHYMNLAWISERATGLLAVIVGLGFVAVAFFDANYRYFHLLVAILAFYYGYKNLKRQETPFEKRERELRRGRL